MSALTIEEQLYARNANIKLKRNNKQENSTDYDEAYDIDIKMENPNYSNQINESPDFISSQIISLQKQIKQSHDNISKETNKLSKLQHKLSHLKHLQQTQNESKIPPQIQQQPHTFTATHNNNHNHNDNHSHSHSHKKHRKRHNNRHQNHNHNNNQVTPQLIREEQRRVVNQEENDREVALQLQRQLDREQNAYQQEIERNRNRNINQHRYQHRNRNLQNEYDEDDEFDIEDDGDEDDEFDQELNFMAIRQRINNNNIINIHPRNPFEFILNSSSFSSGDGDSFDRSGFNEIHRHRIMNNMQDINRMRFGLMEDGFDALSYEQLNNLFPNIPRGANEEAIQRLPTDTINNHDNDYKEKAKEEDKDNNKCCICLEQFKNGDKIRRLPCLHIFHLDEIDQWLRQNRVCPICRINVEQHQ